ncbi:MAG: rhodanese-like domain-containing protein [Thermincolia bacterium]
MILVVLLIAGCGGQRGYKNINVEEAKTMIAETKDLVILDVREQYEFDAGNLPGSILIPSGLLEQNINQLDKEKTILVVCATGARSATAAAFLAEKGFAKVYNLSPGLVAWQ